VKVGLAFRHPPVLPKGENLRPVIVLALRTYNVVITLAEPRLQHQASPCQQAAPLSRVLRAAAQSIRNPKSTMRRALAVVTLEQTPESEALAIPMNTKTTRVSSSGGHPHTMNSQS